LKWKILSSEYLFNDLWFKVRKDICETQQGKIIDPYYVYEFPEWATAFALTEDNKVIMVRQYRHPVGEVILELPGGCVDDTDKDFQTAIARELLEETGYTFGKNFSQSFYQYKLDAHVPCKRREESECAEIRS